MPKANLVTLVLLLCMPLLAFAQKGAIRGTVIEDATGQPLLGVTVVVKGTSTGAVTDFDGKFEIKLQPATYDLEASFVSFEKLTIEGVEVDENEVTIIDNIRLKENVEELEEVVVTAEAIKTTESALLTVKKKSANVIDGISASSFRKIGDSDAASAVKRVPGVSVEDGKYVFVRGLGDRYTKSILNGMDIPGLDPNRNTVQMDLFPTNVIDNIIILKSFTADLPADFTGGVVNVETKDFPEEKVMSISVGVGYNPDMHFQSDYLDYEGGNTDFLGFDDGSRDIPTDRRTDIPQFADVIGRPNSEQGQEYRNILESFNPNLAAMRETSRMNFSLGFSLGDQIAKDKVTLGYNFAVTYKNDTEFFENAKFNRFGKPNDLSEDELEARELQTGDFGVNNVLLGGLGGFAIKTDQSKYKINLMRLQNGESKAGIFEFIGRDQGSNFEAMQHNLEFSERALTNILLTGNHYFQDAIWQVEWKVSPTRSTIDDPDIRFTRFRTDGGGFTVGTESGIPERIWRFLEEDNVAGKVDVTREYQFMGAQAKFKFGAGHTYKMRDYNIQSFQIIPRSLTLTGDPNELFLPENLWPTNASASRGTTFEPQFIPVNPNKFDANINNTAFYVSNEFSPRENLKTIVGVRAENYVQRYTGENQQGDIFDDEKVLDNLDFFPTVNLIYAVTENQNLRASYSRTIARPSFKEASFAEILDPITGRTFIGGFFPDVDVATGEEIWDGNLSDTKIDNFDLRWEIFQSQGQTISAGGFYKRFDDPIEIVQFVQATNNFQPRNVGDGEVIGGEFEIRQSLGFMAGAFENFRINTNVTIVDSKIEMSATEFNSRVRNAREGETVDDTRDMAGQAPFIVNTGLSYNGRTNGLEAGLFYNVQGETLRFVGIADRPDVFSVPFHSVNFNANKHFGEDEDLRIGLKVSNILGDDKQEEFQSFASGDKLFTDLSPGTAVSLSFGYKF